MAIVEQENQSGKISVTGYDKSGRAILGGVETYDANMLPSKTETNINY